MRASVVSCALAFSLASVSAAQGSHFGIAGGVSLGNLDSGDPPQNWGADGWSLSGTWARDLAGGAGTLRIDAGVSSLSAEHFFANDPGGGGVVATTSYQTLGSSANLAWNVVGLEHAVAPYVIAGVGWYAVRQSEGANSNVSMPTVGVIGYSAGLGANISRFFAEIRYAQLVNVPTPYGSRQNINLLPVIVGYRF